MNLYIVTCEPYHDNSCILAVYFAEDVAMKYLMDLIPPGGQYRVDKEKLEHWNDEDVYLQKWDTDTQESEQIACVRHHQDRNADGDHYILNVTLEKAA